MVFTEMNHDRDMRVFKLCMRIFGVYGASGASGTGECIMADIPGAIFCLGSKQIN
jgi:hypothetical protein